MDQVERGQRPVTRTPSRFVSDAFSFLEENDLDHSNIKDGIFKEAHSNPANLRSRENGSIVKGVYTIVTGIQEEKLVQNLDTQSNLNSMESDFRIVDFIENSSVNDGRYINSVYVVEDEIERDKSDIPHQKEVANVDKDTANVDGTIDVAQNGGKRNSVIIDGEEVFLRKSSNDRRSLSARQQSIKDKQNVVSDVFGFLKDMPDVDQRLSAEITDDMKDTKNAAQSDISRSARPPTWRVNQRVVSEAFGFLLEDSDNEERLSTNSVEDSAYKTQPHTSVPASSNHGNRSQRENNPDINTANSNHDNQTNVENSNQSPNQSSLSRKFIDHELTNQNEELQSANQSDSSVLSNQSRASEVSSIASEDIGDFVGGFKKPKTNRDDDGDSSDEDVVKGIYQESSRKSMWFYVGDKKKKTEKPEDYIAFSELGLNTCETDSVFGDNSVPSTPDNLHPRQTSTSTTLSEREFRNHFNSVSKRFVQRADSQQEYKRYTQAFYDNVETYNIEKTDRDSFGIHILDSKPAVVSGVDAGSPAERVGLKEGQVVISVNGVNVLDSDHADIIQLVHKDVSTLTLEVGSGDLSPVLDRQMPVVTGYMQKQVSSTIIRVWKKRYFILRRDNCLYYYKTEQDTDPLGAIPLYGYTFSRHGNSNKFAFKAEKYNSKTFYFLVESREDMTRWVGALNAAGQRHSDNKDAWMEVTANNVGLPALEIRKPDCAGHLNTMGRAMKRWRKRYCVLKDACIYYYKNSDSKEAEGVAHLHGYTVDKLGVSTKKFSFSLEPPEKQMRVFTFYAENETDKNRWIEALNTSIKKWIKVD